MTPFKRPASANPTISVLVVNWNGRHLLPACLASLLAQDGPDFELIVVDNGSTDGSAEWVALNYPTVHLIRLDRNTGFCGGNAAGFRAARGRYIALFNNDAEAAPGWLSALYCAIQGLPDIAACDSRVFFADDRDRLWAAGGDYSIAGSVTHRGYRQRLSGGVPEPPTPVFVAIACAVLYNREALQQVGFFDPDFFSGYEDVDLSFRLHLAGYRVLTIPTAVVYHRVSQTARINSPAYVYWGQRNVLATFLKNMPTALLLKYLPLHLIYTVGSLMYFARQGQLLPALRAKWVVIRHLRSLLRKRRAVQALRVVPLAHLERLFSHDWLRPKLAKLTEQE